MEKPNTFKQFTTANISLYRKIVQYLFLATVVLIGIKYTLFVIQLENGMLPTVTRPPGIEAFLPISSLISLKYWLVTGIFNPIHPSGLIILLMALATALLLKRGFCSWVCPFGLLTEYLNRLHKLIFRKNVKLPPWLDYPLRSLKYLLLAFFLWAIVLKMNAAALDYFIYSPYNMVADIKMLYFFTAITPFAFRVLVGPGGAFHSHSQLLVPLSLSLRRLAGGSQFFECFKNPSQRRNLHQLSKMHPHLPGGHQGA